MLSRGPICLALVLVAGAACAQPSTRPSAAVAQRMVADFYAWYVPMARQDRGPDMRAVRERRAQFAAALVDALRADSAATAQGGEEIDGLDADPFLNAQDPCEQYGPVRTVQRGTSYLVEVMGSGGCRAHRQPDVTVVIDWRAGQPVFANFLYSRAPGDDLVSRLREFARRRRSSPAP